MPNAWRLTPKNALQTLVCRECFSRLEREGGERERLQNTWMNEWFSYANPGFVWSKSTHFASLCCFRVVIVPTIKENGASSTNLFGLHTSANRVGGAPSTRPDAGKGFDSNRSRTRTRVGRAGPACRNWNHLRHAPRERSVSFARYRSSGHSDIPYSCVDFSILGRGVGREPFIWDRWFKKIYPIIKFPDKDATISFIIVSLI